MIKNSILERGQFICNCANPQNLAYFSENREAVADLFRRYRMEWVLGKDGKPLSKELKDWVGQGSKGQIWEYGRGLLGITVEGVKWAPAFVRYTRSFTTVTQGGSDEINLRCTWTWQNVGKLASLLKLFKRRKVFSEAQTRALLANLKPKNAQPEALECIQNVSEGSLS